MTIVNKKMLAKTVAEQLHQTNSFGEKIVDTVLAAIADEVDAGNTVQIHGFGKFEQRYRAARTARNVRTGEPVEVPAKTVMAFKPSKSAA